jgi:hypothetical protein
LLARDVLLVLARRSDPQHVHADAIPLDIDMAFGDCIVVLFSGDASLCSCCTLFSLPVV